ncbi:MAG: hypothetical protein K0Q87_4635 [Neobacillus sp.]|nr:hypothetical protein [Neobacillus sp.]MDF2858784.1 hypothetical protein [Neobacillus sp.]
MKIIDNKSLRREEGRKPTTTQIWQQQQSEARRKEVEARALIITVVPDWRILQELNPIATEIFPSETIAARKKLLIQAIDNRKQLKELIVEPHEPSLYCETHERIEIQSDAQTIEELSEESRNLRLSLDEYVRAILYTKAFNLNSARKERNEQADARDRAQWRVNCEVSMSQELVNKLKEKYFTESDYYYLKKFGAGDGREYGNLLLRIANEYFGIEEDKM